MRGLQVIMDPYERRLLATRSPSMHSARTSLSSSLRCAPAHARPATTPSAAIIRAAGEVRATTTETGGSGGWAEPHRNG